MVNRVVIVLFDVVLSCPCETFSRLLSAHYSHHCVVESAQEECGSSSASCFRGDFVAEIGGRDCDHVTVDWRVVPIRESRCSEGISSTRLFLIVLTSFELLLYLNPTNFQTFERLSLVFGHL